MSLKDETGEEGVAVYDQKDGQKRLTVGSRFAVEKSRVQQHDSKDEQGEAFEKLQEKMMAVNAVDKASHWWRFRVCSN